jgi:AcrR family transcriptional regulator
MSPRSYKSEKRQASSDETKSRIVEAARQLLADESNPADLSLEAIARKADVSRLTIYYQFGSRPGLLEALYDHLAKGGGMYEMRAVFQETDPTKMLEKMVQRFIAFWSSDPVVMRRLRSMSGLDPEIGAGVRARDARRQRISEEIVRRLDRPRAKRAEKKLKLSADVLCMLTSFETYDALARAGHSEGQIARTAIELAKSAIVPQHHHGAKAP